ncbi:hypothetical protein H4R19_000749 [Coemansia spiralis]|nr:hypothetical protein H4R19_000749 [Coemansia spiralis]
MAGFESSQANGIPQFILERGDSAREYRRRSSCISRTSDSSALPDHFTTRFFLPEHRAAGDKGMPGDFESYHIVEAVREAGSSATALDKDSEAQAPPLAPESESSARRRFGFARPRLVHVQK